MNEYTQAVDQLATKLKDRGFGVDVATPRRGQVPTGIQVFLTSRPLSVTEVETALGHVVCRPYIQPDIYREGYVWIDTWSLLHPDDRLSPAERGNRAGRTEALDQTREQKLATLLEKARAVADLAQTTYASAAMDELALQLAAALNAYEEA